MAQASVMCIQDFVELLTADLRKMSDREKFDFRCGVRKAFRMKRPAPKIGDTVTVELFACHRIRGIVKAVYDSVSGKKYQVSSGDITVKVEEGQIVVE